MIVISRTANYVKDGRPMRAAHLLSTQAGAPGRAELIAFAIGIGLNPAWLQKRQTAHEHFDLIGQKIDRAKAAGAKPVTNHELAHILRDKREQLGLARVPRREIFRRVARREMVAAWRT